MKIYYTQPVLSLHSKKFRPVGASFKSSVKESSLKRSLDQWIESNNSFYFQIVGVFILTIGMVLSLQNFLDGTRINTSAQENNSVRILTNFKQPTKSIANSNNLQEVEGATNSVENLKPQAAVEVNYVEYTIKNNDTIAIVATKFKITAEDIIKLNILEPNSSLSVGSRIKIPFQV